MTQRMRHRGPDDEGYVIFDTRQGSVNHFRGDDTHPSLRGSMTHIREAGDGDLGFGFRRLSIVDLTANGHQPMSDESGRFHIVFNGEIYNHRELRAELEEAGYRHRSESDTEVILNAYRHWGDGCHQRLVGMWAFAIFDVDEKRLFLSRDRFGIKPLYYSYDPGRLFAFASEIKPLLGLDGRPQPDHRAIFDYFFRDVTCHGENTFFAGIRQLQPGMHLTITSEHFAQKRWYELQRNTSPLHFKDASLRFRTLLDSAVRLRTRCEWPVGYTLSGGIDSTSILCTARGIWGDGFSGTAFSLVFPGQVEDESRFIQDVVRKLSIPWEAVTATPEDLSRDLSDFVMAQEEPFGMLSYYGEYRLRSLIHQAGVRVTVEGQGADEFVGGYKSLIPSYFESLVLDGRMQQLKRETELFSSMAKASWKGVLTGTLRKWWGGLLAPSYERYTMILPDKLDVSPEDREPWSATLGLEDHMDQMLTKTSIPEQLVKADKSSMAFSSEARFPFLDHRLVEFSRSLPYDYKIGNGVTKRILREAVRDILPATIYERRDKVGFAVPFTGWRDGEVGRRSLEEILDSPASFLDKDAFRENYAGGAGSDWIYWKVASLGMWLNAFIR